MEGVDLIKLSNLKRMDAVVMSRWLLSCLRWIGYKCEVITNSSNCILLGLRHQSKWMVLKTVVILFE